MQKRERTPAPEVDVRHGGAPLSAEGMAATTMPFEGILVMRIPFDLPETGELTCGHIPTHPLNADLRSVDLFPGSQEKPKLPAPAPLPSLTAAFSRRRAVFGAVEVEPETERALVSSDLALAQVRHARRALEGALEHGATLLAALGLPRLVEPGFVPIDPTVAGNAIEAAIAALDAMDAPHDDIEDSHDAEHDTSDAELDLGWNEKISQLYLGDNTADGDETALERAGRGFIRSGPEDAEDDDPSEREEIAVLMHRAATVRRMLHV